jgi:hypothetical protein
MPRLKGKWNPLGFAAPRVPEKFLVDVFWQMEFP